MRASGLRTSKGVLSLGKVPRVVGALSAFRRERRSIARFQCDAVEVRLDLTGLKKDWLECCRAIEKKGIPVILTIRLKAEGGKWTGPDRERLPLFEAALRHLSCVDVELRSDIAPEVGRIARRLRKACIISFHDFEKTPSSSRLQAIITDGRKLGSVVKLATMVNSDKDLATLRKLLARSWRIPLCVIGMGPLGAAARLSFALAGSCLTYGYLEKSTAPGQWSAQDLVKALKKSSLNH